MENLHNNPNFEKNQSKIVKKSQTNINSDQKLPTKENQPISENNSIKNSPVPVPDSNIVNKHNINFPNIKEQSHSKVSAGSIVSNNSLSSRNPNKSDELHKDIKKQKINNILGGLKLKYNYRLSPSTDLKSFGELLPGPGQYYNPEIKIGQGQNLRYNNLFKDPEQNIVLKYKLLKDNYYQSKIGPGTYNLNNGYEHKSYSQNPKTFISQLERGPLFKISDSVGPGNYNLAKNYNKKDINIKTENNSKKKKDKHKNKFILETEPFLERDDINVVNTYNNNNLNKSKVLSGKISFKGHKNFSWKGISDFSGLGIKSISNENKEMFKDDKIKYKNQFFNFNNQNKLNIKKNKFSKTTKKLILKEISEYNKINKPLIDYVPKDVVLKGNHLPGPCYYNYTNDSIEGDIKELNKRNKIHLDKKWK